MRILVVHNTYKQSGGEDTVFNLETAALEEYGHEVTLYTQSNHDLDGRSRVGMAVDTVWNRTQYKLLRQVIKANYPDVVHFHNTFPLISPAAYYAARSEGVPVVQTLHNFRLMCLNAMLFRDGKPCEDCVLRRSFIPGIRHGCYHNSRTTSAVVATMLTIHRKLGTWRNLIDAYIALTDFAKRKFVSAGLPAGKIHIKPNFIHPDPGAGAGTGGYALFVGRLSEEKGITNLLRAWAILRGKLRLNIVGDGPLAPVVAAASKADSTIQWLGYQPKAEVYRLMGDAKFLIVPSTWYEGMPLVVVESFAKGTPVLSSDIGSMASININRHTGLHFSCDTPECISDTINAALADTDQLIRMRLTTRAEFVAKYSVTSNIGVLTNIYETVIRQYRAQH